MRDNVLPELPRNRHIAWTMQPAMRPCVKDETKYAFRPNTERSMDNDSLDKNHWSKLYCKHNHLQMKIPCFRRYPIVQEKFQNVPPASLPLHRKALYHPPLQTWTMQAACNPIQQQVPIAICRLPGVPVLSDGRFLEKGFSSQCPNFS